MKTSQMYELYVDGNLYKVGTLEEIANIIQCLDESYQTIKIKRCNNVT